MNFFKKKWFFIVFIVLFNIFPIYAGLIYGPDSGTLPNQVVTYGSDGKHVNNSTATVDNSGGMTLTGTYFNTNNSVGLISFTNAYSLLITNQSFTYALPDSVKTKQVCTSVQVVTNISGTLIIITPHPSWNSVGTWNCTNHSIVTITSYPLVGTDAVCTPFN